MYLLAEPVTFPSSDGNFDYSPDFWIPEVGTQVSAICRLEVMAAYESEAEVLGFDEPNIRYDWVVHHVRVQHRALYPVPGLKGTRAPGEVLSVDDVDRMRRWADDPGRDHVEYIVDLAIAT